MDIVMAYVVHSSQLEHLPVKAVVNGIEVMATAPRLVVELTSDDGEHGHTFRLPVSGAADVAKWSAAFAVRSKVRLTLTAGDPA